MRKVKIAICYTLMLISILFAGASVYDFFANPDAPDRWQGLIGGAMIAIIFFEGIKIFDPDRKKKKAEPVDFASKALPEQHQLEINIFSKFFLTRASASAAVITVVTFLTMDGHGWEDFFGALALGLLFGAFSTIPLLLIETYLKRKRK